MITLFFSDFIFIKVPMSLFEPTVKVDYEKVKQIVAKYWNLTLGKSLRVLENHTFEAFSHNQQQKYIARITPDPSKKHIKRMTQQLKFLEYLNKNNLHYIHSSVPPKKEGSMFISQEDLNIVVFQWAKGEKIQFNNPKWIEDTDVPISWGKFFAQFHQLSRKFQEQNPGIAKNMQSYQNISGSILKDFQLHPEDNKQVYNPQHFGIIHGDLHLGNFHYLQGQKRIYAFDTDQLQRGFYLYDLAGAIIIACMFEEGGLIVTGQPLKWANRQKFQKLLIQGYQSEGQKVDLQRLNRMIAIKKHFYVAFALRALQEGCAPQQTIPYVTYMKKNFEKTWFLKNKKCPENDHLSNV